MEETLALYVLGHHCGGGIIKGIGLCPSISKCTNPYLRMVGTVRLHHIMMYMVPVPYRVRRLLKTGYVLHYKGSLA